MVIFMTTAKNDIITFRCSKEEKNTIMKLCQKEGIDITTFFRLCIRQAKIDGIRLKLEIPNAETIKALEAAEHNLNMKKFNSVDDLYKDLGI